MIEYEGQRWRNKTAMFRELAALHALSKETVRARWIAGLRGEALIAPAGTGHEKYRAARSEQMHRLQAAGKLNRIEVEVGGKVYRSLTALALDYGLCPATVWKRYRNGLRGRALCARTKYNRARRR